MDETTIRDGFIEWLDSEIESIYELKHFGEPINNKNTVFWNNIIPQRNQANMVKNTPAMRWCVITDGISVRDSSVIVIPHLIQTEWGQGYPWNFKLPFDVNASHRCYLGCTAVAIGQMLYYCHYSIGKPSSLYHQISCSKTSINGPTTDIGFSRNNFVPNSDRWDYMASDDLGLHTDYAGDLMIDVGNRLGMNYSGQGSGASPSVAALSAYNLSYSESDYSYSTVYSQLNANKPLVIVAYSTQYTTGIWPFKKTHHTDGHTWIIDGIAQTQHIVTYTKHIEYTENWSKESEVYNSLDEILSIYNVSDINSSFQDTTIIPSNHLLMNWGYDGTYDDGFYSINANDEWMANGGGHLYLRHIYYDFH